MPSIADRIIAEVEARMREREAAREAGIAVEELEDRPRPKPRLVVDHGPAWRPPGWVTPDLAAYERAWEAQQADRAADRAHRKAIDPMGYGHWGPTDDDA